MAQSFNTNLNNVAAQYIRQLNIPLTETTLKLQLLQNPYYPSLYSISNVFDKLHIPNQAFAVEEQDIEQIEPPFITYCSNQNTGKDFVLVTNITGKTVSYIAQHKKPQTILKEDFIKHWQKIVFVAEANTQSGEKDYFTKLKSDKAKKNKQLILYTGIACLIGLLVYQFIHAAGAAYVFAATAIAITKLMGVAVTVLLLIYETDKTNSFVKNICTAGKQLNCDAVLKSKAGKIFGISWAEAGFFYFATTSLFLFWPGIEFGTKMPWLAIVCTLAAAYIPFSIYYQWRVVKQWCPLCLAVQATLTIELFWSAANFWSSKSIYPSLTTGVLLAIGFSLLFPLITWYLLKPLLYAAKDAPLYKNAYKRLLYNPEIFNGLLHQQQQAPDGWQTMGIDIGNPEAANTIIKVCNPYCGPCAKAHPVLEEIIEHNKDVKVKMIFTATNAETDRANKPVKHLLAIAAKQNAQQTEKALDEWYMADKKDYEAFAAKYPMNGELQQQGSKLEHMGAWCKEAEITATPTIFVNGRRLPETYNINELKNIF